MSSGFVDKVQKFIKERGLLSAGDRVCVALSGGADSSALFGVLLALKGELDLTLSAVHVNHGLRGEESDRDEQFVKMLCEAHAVPFFVFHPDVKGAAARDGLSIETAARQERYRCFEGQSASGQCLVATAHTLSDSAETMLINLFRGTGLQGLTGIPARRGAIIRPLLSVTGDETLAFAEESGLGFVTDSSNLTDAYFRNRIRHHLVPQLKRLKPEFETMFARAAENLREDEALLSAITEKTYRKFSREGFRTDFLLSLPNGLQARVLKELFRRFGLQFDRKNCMLIRSLAQSPKGAVQVGRNCFVTVNDGVLSVETREKKVKQTAAAFVGADGAKLLHMRAIVVSSEFIHGEDTFFAVDCDKLTGTPMLRTRREGDTVKLPGRPTKTVKKLQSERHIEKRDEKILLCDELGVVWLEDFGPAERAAADEATKKLILMGVCQHDER